MENAPAVLPTWSRKLCPLLIVIVLVLELVFIVESGSILLSIFSSVPISPGLPVRRARPNAYIYIDAGTNDGASVLEFLLQHPRVSPDWHIAMIEANPVHADKIDFVKGSVEDMGHTTTVFFPRALMVEHNSTITFYLDNSAAHTYAATTVGGSISNSGEKIVVPTVNLAYVHDHILGGLRREDYVVTKIDIEGAEYDVLLNAMDLGLPHLWDELWVEFHHDNRLVLKGTPLEAAALAKYATIVERMRNEFNIEIGSHARL